MKFSTVKSMGPVDGLEQKAVNFMRLDKFLSEAKVASRKELRSIIRAGRVTVDGVTAKSPEEKIDETCQEIAVDGAVITAPGRLVLMLHKPAGFVTSTEDPRDRTVMELIPEEYCALGLKPVGRLDKETEGLLLFTNDGGLSHRLTSPRHRVEKAYFARTETPVDEADAEAFQTGIELRDGTRCLPAELTPGAEGCYIVIREGKYHQVRRMLASRGKPVTYLRREREGNVTLGDLSPGQCRLLTQEEVEQLTVYQSRSGV